MNPMNAVYVRLLAYVLSALLGSLPAWAAGFVAFDAATNAITISLEGIVIAVTGGLAMSGGIFAKWGKK